MSRTRKKDAGQDDFVPLGFEDLRRDTAEERARFAADADLRRRMVRNQGLIGDQSFMKASRRVSVASTIVGTLLLLAGVRAPLMAAARTAPGLAGALVSMSGEGAAALEPTAKRLLAQARAFRESDERGVALARRGLACLNGTGPCPAGRTPLR